MELDLAEPLLLETVVCAVSDQMSSELNGETVILNVGTGAYFGLNRVATAIWELTQRPIMVAEVRDAVVREFDVPLDRAEADILALLSDMLKAGLLRIQVRGRT